MNDPAKRDLLAKKEELEQKIDALKYQKAAMEPGEYKKQLTAALVQLATVQGNWRSDLVQQMCALMLALALAGTGWCWGAPASTTPGELQCAA